MIWYPLILLGSALIGAAIGLVAVKLFMKPRSNYSNQKPYQPPGEFVREETGLTVEHTVEIWHLEGVDWSHAEIPPRNHLCWTQTKGTLSSGAFVRRCACGAISMNDYDDRNIYWMDRNSRTVAPS